ncbi:uncharacterized protein C7orf57 homolog isoform X4 [Syngnathoides biaculeatus]|uniref:uncharacterized protein C7orf57 homolog isoform X4 n=2 Tax=Syngnathoides biaculeatus TaxID=300417 RepID=UPI002ADE3499|nr:uncharacterized protein C7orf57 homolog isoform X4 [Syngnathoides biaculeatus]
MTLEIPKILRVLMFIQRNLASGKKGYMHGIKGQISQIPGLSPTVHRVSDVKNIGKRVGLLDSDSDYVKLAKQGGHKGLLYFDDTVASKPNSYDSPDVLLNGPVEAPGNQSVLCTKERKTPRASAQRSMPPFWTDNMSAWERDDNGSQRKEMKKVPEKQLVEWQTPSPNKGGSKFRRTVSTKKTSPVNMSKLLSFGYIDDDRESTSEIESTAT